MLFGLLAIFCLFLFTRVDRRRRVTGRKQVRNRIYRACGIVIATAGVVALASNLLSDAAYDRYKPLLTCEALAVFAFGVAWLIKGETIFKDSHADSTGRGSSYERPPKSRIADSGFHPSAVSTSLPAVCREG